MVQFSGRKKKQDNIQTFYVVLKKRKFVMLTLGWAPCTRSPFVFGIAVSEWASSVDGTLNVTSVSAGCFSIFKYSGFSSCLFWSTFPAKVAAANCISREANLSPCFSVGASFDTCLRLSKSKTSWSKSVYNDIKCYVIISHLPSNKIVNVSNSMEKFNVL